MERLGVKWDELKSALWKSKLGTLLLTLQTRVEQGGAPMDPLAQHEYESRQRGTPAHFDRVREQAMRERQRDPNP